MYRLVNSRRCRRVYAAEGENVVSCKNGRCVRLPVPVNKLGTIDLARVAAVDASVRLRPIFDLL